ncbi:MAG: hypothetical protein J07HQW1_00062, partial [Haloquadratum walsbyi J07HQW1]
EENLTVEFTPVTRGDSDVLINISTNATRTPQVSIPASGTGIAPEINVSTQLIQFGNVPVSASNTQSEVLNIQNDGNTDLSINISSNSSITTNQVNPFGTNRSGQTIIIPPDEQENLETIFDPPEGGNFAGSLTIGTNSSFTESVEIRLSGVGAEGAISVQPEQVDLGNLTIGDSERTRALVENNGTALVTVSPQLNNSTDFNTTLDDFGSITRFGSNNNITIIDGTSESLNLNVTQESGGNDNATIILVPEEQSIQNQTIEITTTGLVPTADISRTDVDFGDVAVNSTGTETVSINNTGSGVLRVNRVNIIGNDTDEFNSLAGDSSDIAIDARDQETVSIQFTPTAQGEFNASLNLTTNNGTQTIALNGTGIGTNLSVNDSAIDFGEQGNSSVTTRDVAVSNDGNAEISVTATIEGTDAGEFARSPETATLSANETTTLSLTYEPTSVAAHSALVNISGDSANESASVSLSGRSTPPDASEPGDVQFGFVPAENTATESVTLENLGANSTTLEVTDLNI